MKICIDAATQGTSFGVVITTGAFPFAVAWTLGTEAPPWHTLRRKATEIRPFEPFADPRAPPAVLVAVSLHPTDRSSMNCQLLLPPLIYLCIDLCRRCIRKQFCLRPRERLHFEDTSAQVPSVEVHLCRVGGRLFFGSELNYPDFLHVSSSTFHRSTAFLGTAIYNSLAIVKFDNSFVVVLR